MSDTFHATAKLWIWTTDKAPASWHFLTIEGDTAEGIRTSALMQRLELGLPKKRGWGSIKVTAMIGETRWSTSMFPNSDNGGLMLPVKASVRLAEGLIAGDDVRVQISV